MPARRPDDCRNENHPQGANNCRHGRGELDVRRQLQQAEPSEAAEEQHRTDNPKKSASGGDDGALLEQVRDNRPSPRTEHKAYAEVVLATREAGEQQMRDVGACDEKQQQRYTAHEDESVAEPRTPALAQWLDLQCSIAINVGITAAHCRGDDRQFGLGCGRRHAGRNRAMLQMKRRTVRPPR